MTRRICSALLLALLTSCADDPPPSDQDPQYATDVDVDAAFASAAAESGVPVAFLEAIAELETGRNPDVIELEFDLHGDEAAEDDADGTAHQAPSRYGIMGLSAMWLDPDAAASFLRADLELSEAVGTAALDKVTVAFLEDQLAEVLDDLALTEDEVRTSYEANIRYTAAVLARLGEATGAELGDLGSWSVAIGTLSGIALPDDFDGAQGRKDAIDDARASYLSEVYRLLVDEDPALKAALTASSGIAVAPNAGRSASIDFGEAIWRPTNNKSSGRGSHDVEMIVVHSCESSYAICWSWLRDPRAKASAHYVVNHDGSEVSQLVREDDRAWHVKAKYKKELNSGELGHKHDVSTNRFSVGIEHAGHAAQTSWNDGLVATSAQLSCDIAARHQVPVDRFHIRGHGELQPHNRTDPGAGWPWASYVNAVQTLAANGCVGSGPLGQGLPADFGTMTVDSRLGSNPAHTDMVRPSGKWKAVSTASAPNPSTVFETGYWRRKGEDGAKPARFGVKLADSGLVEVSIHWPADPDQASNVPVVVRNGAGSQLAVEDVDQSTGGGQWVTLGTYDFTPGWNEVWIAAEGADGFVAADAVRFESQD